MKIEISLVTIAFLAVLMNSVLADRTKDKIYENVYGSMCFRRLNATHQTGCSSTSSGSVGVLHLINGDSDFNFILNKPPAPPYAVVMTPRHFTRENILRLRDSMFVSAIVLINDTRGMESFSQESKCPNQFFRHAKQPTCNLTKPETTWNPYGTGLMQESFDIPIIFISSKNESEKVIKCFNDFNKDFENQSSASLCSIEVNSMMAAAGNTEICIRRTGRFQLLNQVRYCDPLQGKNVYGTLFPRAIVSPENRSVETSEKIILITARLDTTSNFDGLGLGAMDSLASAATLLTTGHFLRKIVSNTSGKKTKDNVNVMFVLFNGESFDYIGSQRLVYDLKKGNVFPSPSSHTKPITLDNVLLVIDIGPLDEFNELSLYEVSESIVGQKFIESTNHYKMQLKLNVSITSRVTNNLPPVSAQTFLRENSSFPALIVATKKPTNKFYHSIYDEANNLNYIYKNSSLDFDKLSNAHDPSEFDESSVQVKIRNIATIIGLAVYDMLYDDHKFNQNLVGSAALVDEFLYCYLIATKCRLFDSIYEFQGEFRGNDFPPQRYISVQGSVTLEATGWAYRLFGFILSEKIDQPKENCSTLPLYWIPGSSKKGECRVTTQNFSLALSPAFEEDGYNYKSNQYSTWTESTWHELSARIFLRPSATHESLTFSIGFVVMILSFVVVYLVNSADVLFNVVAVEHVSLPAQC